MKLLPSNLYKLTPAALGLLFCLLANSAGATVLYWDNNDPNPPTSGTWDTTSSFWATTSTQPATPGVWNTADAAGFCAGSASAGAITITVNSAIACAGFFNGGVAQPGCNLTLSGSGSLSLNSGVQGCYTTNGFSTAISLPLTGPGGIISEGAGLLTLSGANTYSGNTTISAGTLRQGAVNAIPYGTGNGTFAVSSGATFDLGGYNCQINGFGSGSAGIIDCTSGTATLTIDTTNTSGTVTHSGVIQNTSPGVLNITVDDCPTGPTIAFTGANTYSGITTINNGLLQIIADDNLGAAPGTAVTNSITLNPSVNMSGVNYGLRLQTTAAVALNANRGIFLGANGGAIQCQSGKTLTINGIITGPGALYAGGGVAGAGIGGLILANAGNNYTGGTYIFGGNLQLGANNTLPAGAPLTMGTSSAGSGTYFYMEGHNQTIGPLTGPTGANGPQIQLTGALDIIQTNSTIYGGQIQSAGGSLTLDAASTSTLTLSGSNSYSGPTTINGGTLEINNASGLPTLSITVANGGVLKLDFNTALKPTNTLNLAGSPAAATVNLNFSGTQTINALSFGAHSLVPGTWGAVGSAATHQNAAFTTTTGVLQVNTGGANPTISITSITPNPACADSTVSLTATVGGGDSPSGSVQFFNGVTSLGTQPLASGMATLTGVSLPAGTYANITAQYSGDNYNNAVTSLPASPSLVVNNCSGPNITNIVHNANGSFTLTCTAAIGTDWFLDANSTVTTPLPWMTLQSGTNTINPFTITDGPAGLPLHRFYYLTNH